MQRHLGDFSSPPYLSAIQRGRIIDKWLGIHARCSDEETTLKDRFRWKCASTFLMCVAGGDRAASPPIASVSSRIVRRHPESSEVQGLMSPRSVGGAVRPPTDGASVPTAGFGQQDSRQRLSAGCMTSAPDFVSDIRPNCRSMPDSFAPPSPRLIQGCASECVTALRNPMYGIAPRCNDISDDRISPTRRPWSPAARASEWALIWRLSLAWAAGSSTRDLGHPRSDTAIGPASDEPVGHPVGNSEAAAMRGPVT